jgi:hypothetical protein
MLEEGPGTGALGEDHPVLVPALSSDPSVQRWQAFAPAALAIGVSAVFAFPLVMGAIAVGALEIHRGREGELTAAELAETLLFAEAVLPRALIIYRHRAPSRGLSCPAAGSSTAGPRSTRPPGWSRCSYAAT